MAKNRITLHFVNLNVQNDVIPVDWYTEMHNVKGICFRNGNITAIESNAFYTKAFNHLYYLEFDGLAIKYITSETFNGLVNLRVLILRNLNLNIFQSDLQIPTKNSAWNDVHQTIELYSVKSVLKRNCSNSLSLSFVSQFSILNLSKCIEMFYLNEDTRPTSPWIIIKKLKVFIITTLTSSIFSFSLGMKLSFSILHSFRKISRKLKRFLNNFEDDAASIYTQRTRIPIRKSRKIHFID